MMLSSASVAAASFGGGGGGGGGVLPSLLRLRRSYVSQTQTSTTSTNEKDYIWKVQEEKLEKKKKRLSCSAPLLMLSSPKSPQTRYLYDLNGDDIRLNREIHLPDLAGHHCIGSSKEGFLITVDIASGKSTDIHVTNPLTGATLSLPSAASLSDIDSSFHFCSRNHDPDEEKWRIPKYPNLIPTETNYTHLYRSKAILSLSHNLLFLARDRLPPVFTTLLHDQDSPPPEWSPHHLMFGGLDDYIFHKGHLYSVLKNTYLIVANLHNPFVTATILPFRRPLFSVDYHTVSSLVESPDGEDLFLVSRAMTGEKNREHYFYHSFEEIPDPHRYTVFFDVFKLEDYYRNKTTKESKRKNMWKWVDSVGDLAMFVGSNCQSFSLHACDFPGLKSNCIYFTDITDTKWKNFVKVDRDGDTGVYHLEDDSIQLFRLTDDDDQELNWPPPVWYMPPSPPTLAGCLI